MNHGSLFSGIGGFDLAAEWMGWQNVFHCEWNPFGQRLLKYYWPNAISYHDITKTDFTVHRGSIDILTGGFPCQPYSTAGKRLGKADERHLWPEMLRAIREIRPRWVVGENVLGLVNWSDGLVFEEVCAALEAEGYEVQSFVLPACAANAPHRRDRVWFVANDTSCERLCDVTIETWRRRDWKSFSTSCQWLVNEKDWNATHPNGNGQHGSNGKHGEQSGEGREYAQRDVGESDDDGDAADTENTKLQTRNDRPWKIKSWRRNSTMGERHWSKFPSVSPVCDGNDGISDRLDGITFSQWRNESIKGGGNAVVPQVVLQIFKAIEEYESKHTS